MPTTPNPTFYIKAIPAGLQIPNPEEIFEKRHDTIDLDGRLDGTLLVESISLSIDPYLGILLQSAQAGTPMTGMGIARVLRSDARSYDVGNYVLTWQLPWSRYSTLRPEAIEKKIDNPGNIPWYKFLTVFGWTALTAWCGYKLFAQAKKGETIYVSTAAGTVGCIVAQLAKLDGLKVIGSTGSDAKVKYLKDELGLDYAFNYKSESVDEALSNAGPVDIYYDNVGGATLEAAIDHLNDWSRIIVCGYVSSFDAEPHGVKNLSKLVSTNTTLNAFRVYSVVQRYGRMGFDTEFVELVKAKKISIPEQVSVSLDDAPTLLSDVLQGRHSGKPVIDLSGAV